MTPEPHENLPAVPETAVEEKIFDGEVVEEATAVRPGTSAVRAAVAHPAARTAARHLVYVAAGVIVLVRRWHMRRTRYERLMRGAEAAGNAELVVALLEQQESARTQRAKRRADTIRSVVDLVKVSPVIGIIALIAMALIGISLAVLRHRPADVFWPWLALFHAVVLAVEVASVAWAVFTFAAIPAAAAGLWHVGRTAGDLAPRWAATSGDADVDLAIDEAAVTQALKQLRIPQIADHLKLGLPMAYILPCRQEGRGTGFEIRLPLGLPASEITKHARRERLAAGLYRKTKETWLTVGADESILRGWIADKGALEEGAGPYPLLTDGLTDVFRGVPFGRTLRGDEVTAPLMERNTITGGMPGQGKSSAARVIMAGAMLDPSVEAWIMIPDVNFDFELMKRRCSRYVMGAEDENVETIRDWLSDLKDEVQRRGQKLVDYEIPSVTRKLASAGVGLHPMLVLLEEAHVAIQHHIYGKEIAGLLVDIVKLGRKRGIHVIVSTQAPTKESMPRDVTRNCSNGIAFAVGDHVPNDALLGAGAYRAGHRATDLIPGTDRGIAVVKGFSGERSEMVQVYFLSVDDPDQVTPIIDRALAEVARLGKGLPGGLPPLKAIEARNLLDDLDEVIRGDGRVKLRDAIGLLRNLAPSWTRYKDMTAAQLEKDLGGEGVPVINTSGTKWLDPAKLRAVLAGREVSE